MDFSHFFRKRAETSFQKFDIFLFFQNFALASLAQEFFQTFPPPYYLNPKTCHSRGGGDIHFNCLDEEKKENIEDNKEEEKEE
ncbi:MAG: hypothetical protein GY928_27390 [Colwellia sp.]|nr:hypothetical protein [Colwellia sp.]